MSRFRDTRLVSVKQYVDMFICLMTINPSSTTDILNLTVLVALSTTVSRKFCCFELLLKKYAASVMLEFMFLIVGRLHACTIPKLNM